MPFSVSENLKTQVYFNSSTNNNLTKIAIIPSTANTPIKVALQAKYPGAVIQSKLEIIMLELRVRITSSPEYNLPASAIDGTSTDVTINRDLIRSLWDNPRKQLDIWHRIDSNSPLRVRGSLSLLNKGSAELYYLEDFLGVFTTEGTYPLSDTEDIQINLKDCGYGFLQGIDEILFTGIFKHTVSVANDAFLVSNGSLIELATFDQAQTIISQTSGNAIVDLTPIAKTLEVTALQSSVSIVNTKVDNLVTNIPTARLTTLQNSVDSANITLDILSNASTPPNLVPLQTGIDSVNTKSDTIIATSNIINGKIDVLSGSIAPPDLSALESSVNAIAAQIVVLQASIAGISGGGGNSSPTLNPNLERKLDIEVTINDLFLLLGTVNGVYTNPHSSKLQVTASGTGSGAALATLTSRAISTGWNSTNVANSWVQVDFAGGTTPALGRKVTLTGLALRANSTDALGNPFALGNLSIEGSDDNVTYIEIFQWLSQRFTTDNEWRGREFSNSIPYRYIRIRQTTPSLVPNNVLSLRQIAMYGAFNFI